MRKPRLKRWETTLIAFSGAWFVASFATYITGLPLRNYLFGLPEDGREVPIGKLTSASGEIRREIAGQIEFKGIEQGSVLFRRDTVMTGDRSSATLTLDGGSAIELGPKTMVKLEAETSYTFTGVSRTTFVDIVSGQLTGRSSDSPVVIRTSGEEILLGKNTSRIVRASADLPEAPGTRSRRLSNSSTGLLSGLNLLPYFGGGPAHPLAVAQPLPQAGPSATPSPSPSRASRPKPTSAPTPTPTPRPSPSPSPFPAPSAPIPVKAEFGVHLVDPAMNARLEVAPGSGAAERSIGFRWRVSMVNRARRPRALPAAILTVHKISQSDAGKRERIFQRSVPSEVGINSVNWIATEPGQYEWSVKLDHSAPSSRFSVAPEFVGIQLLAPEMLKRSADPSLPWLERNRPRVRLAWKPYAGASDYTITVSRQDGARPTVSKTAASDLTLAQKTLDQSEMKFQVTTTLPSGFIVRSPESQFLFDFTPPDPVTPARRAVLKNEEQPWDQSGVLLTWQKTGVSEAYGLEIARDAGFRYLIVKRTVKDNFFIFRPKPVSRTYWWRVRAYAKGKYSQPSDPFEFTVTK